MNRKTKPVKYLWEKKTCNELQFWPKTSSERYITRPTLPSHLVKNKSAKISAPLELSIDVLGTRGIFNAAITEHNGNYYQSRQNEDFSIVIYTLDGKAEVCLDKRIYKLNKNSVFVAPAGTSYELRATGHWKNIWFHIKGKEWNRFFGTNTLILKSKNQKRIKNAVFDYYEEVYKVNRALRLLEIYADLISYFIRDEFNITSDREAALLNSVFMEMRSNMMLATEKILKLPNIASSAKLMRSRYGITLHEAVMQIKMREARELLKEGFTLAEIAKKVGYSNAYAFSKAFKHRHGMAPTFYK